MTRPRPPGASHQAPVTCASTRHSRPACSSFFSAVGSPPHASNSRTSHSLPSSKARTSLHSSSIRPQYVSAYRRDTPTITYDTYQFTQTTCETNESGTPCFVQSGDIKTILIGQGWYSHVKGGKPAGAYLSKGFTKFAFRVSLILCYLVNIGFIFSPGPH